MSFVSRILAGARECPFGGPLGALLERRRASVASWVPVERCEARMTTRQRDCLYDCGDRARRQDGKADGGRHGRSAAFRKCSSSRWRKSMFGSSSIWPVRARRVRQLRPAGPASVRQRSRQYSRIFSAAVSYSARRRPGLHGRRMTNLPSRLHFGFDRAIMPASATMSASNPTGQGTYAISGASRCSARRPFATLPPAGAWIHSDLVIAQGLHH